MPDEQANRGIADRLLSYAGVGPIGDPVIALMRLVLASSVLLDIYVDPSKNSRYVPIIYGALALYTFYSLAVFILAIRDRPLVRSISLLSHWIDIGWCTVLVALSSGTNNTLFVIYLFPILVASLRHGFESGSRTAIASAASFTIVGVALGPPEVRAGWFNSVDRPAYLLAIGLMMAYWGGHENAARRRLKLLKDVNNWSNPRFGIDRTIGTIMERLRSFYDADACLLITAQLNGEGQSYTLRRADRHTAEGGTEARPIDQGLAGRLLAAPAGCALLYRTRHRWTWWGNRFYTYDPRTGVQRSEGLEAGRALANLLEAGSFVAAPTYHHGELAGQICLTARRKAAFTIADVDFILQVADQVIPVIDNIQVVGELASNAAEQERERIARNIHDNAIQLYVGLQAGLTSLRQNLAAAIAATSGDATQLRETVTGVVDKVDRLIEMTSISSSNLRGQMKGLKGRGDRRNVLLSSVERLAGNFSKVTGIAVYVKGDQSIRVNDRLAAEIYQMAVEGLSNIRRHTRAKLAVIGLQCSGDYLALQIENDNANKREFVQFTPRSIAGRAEALGGQWRVERNRLGRTVLTVEVPL